MTIAAGLGVAGMGQLLSVIMEAVDEGIHVVDAAGVTIYYNRVAGSYEGLEPEEVIGRPLLEVFPSLTVETSTLLRVLKTREPIYNLQQTFRNFKGKMVVTVNSTLPVFLEGMLVGAVEIAKDLTRVNELASQIVHLQAELCRTQEGNQAARQARYTMDDLIGNCPALLATKKAALRAARSTSPVLVYGETGTGKELLVQAIHNAGPRREAPFVAQNCAALPEALLEGILFGSVKGSFTGAENRPGLFELAHGGTLFLDEITCMNINLQAKLLRVLQESSVRRLGDGVVRPVDVRVIAATNLDPLREVQEGRLRSDLYYRLNVVSVQMPPLRERRADIPLLTGYFITRFNKRLGMAVQGVAADVQQLFQVYPWPGNVRELEYTIEGAMNIMDAPVIQAEHLPPALRAYLEQSVIPAEKSKNAATHPTLQARDRGPAPGGTPSPGGEAPVPGGDGQFWAPCRGTWGDKPPLRVELRRVEADRIRQALAQAGGNVSRAAALLGIPRQTLQYRLRQLPMDDPAGVAGK